MTGLVVGLTRFIWENVYKKIPCGSSEADPRHTLIKDIHYLHFGIILFAFAALVAVVVSLFTKPIEEKYVSEMVYIKQSLKASY